MNMQTAAVSIHAGGIAQRADRFLIVWRLPSALVGSMDVSYFVAVIGDH